MCVQGSQKCPGLKKLLRRTMVRRSTTPTRPMESHAAQSDVARPTTLDSQPRRSNNKVTLFSVNVTVNFL